MPNLISTEAARDTEVAQLRRILPLPLLEQERHASFLRWHAYRFMSATECTRQFASDYEAAFAMTFGMRCDMQPELGTKDFELLWQMRQAADDMIMPYPLYLEVSFQQVRRKDPRTYSIPHLHFARLQKGVKWLKLHRKLWPERVANELRRVSDLPQFHLSNDLGLPTQQHFRRILSSSQEPHEAARRAASYAIERRIVTVGDALGRLSGEDRRMAVERLKLEVASGQISRRPDPRTAKPDELIQTCYGWGWHDRTSERCEPCTDRAGCVIACGASC